MPTNYKETLTVAELKSLLLARFAAEKSTQAKLKAYLYRELGKEMQEEKMEVIAIENKLADLVSDMIACRLKQNERIAPPLSPQDLITFLPSMIEEIEKETGDEFEAEERTIFEKFIKAVFKNILEMAPPAAVLSASNEDYWLWITTVLDLAAERGILPTELLSLQDATDEITRRLSTEEQFVAFSKEALGKFTDADMIKKIIVEPLLDMLATEADEEDRRELEEKIESEIMPQLRETVEKSKSILNVWLGEEVERIYRA